MHATATPEIRATLERMTVQERIRRATDGGEVYIPNTLSPGQTPTADVPGQERSDRSVYLEAAEETSRWAVEWFTQYLKR